MVVVTLAVEQEGLGEVQGAEEGAPAAEEAEVDALEAEGPQESGNILRVQSVLRKINHHIVEKAPAFG